MLDRKLVTTAGRKAVIGRPILYKTSKEFLLRFGLKDVNELPSMEEFEKLLAESFQSDLIPGEASSKEDSSIPPLTAGDHSSESQSQLENDAEITESADPELTAEETEAPASTKPE